MARAGLGPKWRCLFANDNSVRKGSAYRANWGSSELRVGGVAELTVADLPSTATLAWASWPCTDLSLAGDRAGLAGERSGTFWPFWSLMTGLAAENRAPPIIALENVPGLLTSDAGADFAAIGDALVAGDYRFGAVVIDASHFVPQSRGRVFVVVVRRSQPIPDTLVAEGPGEPWHSPELMKAHDALSASARDAWVWWRLPAPPIRNTVLADLLEPDEAVDWDQPDYSANVVATLSPATRVEFENMVAAGERSVRAMSRRTRGEPQWEAMPDGVAGCLRTAGGGSSIQRLLIVGRDGAVRTRRLSPRESARLMGLPDSYVLPASTIEALSLAGDGVAVPVVRFLAEHILEPLIDATRSSITPIGLPTRPQSDGPSPVTDDDTSRHTGLGSGASPSVSRNGSHFSAVLSSIETPVGPELDAIARDAALTVFCDFETRNTGGCDLKTAGAWRYAADPATEILCFGYRTAGVDHSWVPTSGSRDPLDALAADPDVAFVCFAAFEPVVWRKIMVECHGFPPIPTRRWVDLRAVCCSFALPRSLDKALAALGLPIQKDKAGQRLVRSLSRLDRKTGAYPELTPAVVERIAKYNRIDIVALEAMHGRGLSALTTSEQPVWGLDQRINARGIAIDVDFVEAAKRIADQAMGEAIAEFAQLTEGLSPHQVQKTREWLKSRKWSLPNLDSETVTEALEQAGLPDDARRVLEIRQLAAAISLKKLDAMLACVGADGRARGLLQYHGATTGRWSGQLIQPQNFPRPTLEVDIDPEELTAAVKTGDPDELRRWGKPIDVLVSGLRHALTAADGAVFGAGDFSMIEACVLLALAGQHDKCKLIAQGVDVYRDMAATIYGLDRAAFMAIPEDDLSPEQVEQRRIGKNGVLSSGYQIGAEGFYRRFCRHIEDGKELATRIVGVYRHQWAPTVPRLWRDLEQAARRAMLRPHMAAVADLWHQLSAHDAGRATLPHL